MPSRRTGLSILSFALLFVMSGYCYGYLLGTKAKLQEQPTVERVEQVTTSLRQGGTAITRGVATFKRLLIK